MEVLEVLHKRQGLWAAREGLNKAQTLRNRDQAYKETALCNSLLLSMPGLPLLTVIKLRSEEILSMTLTEHFPS